MAGQGPRPDRLAIDDIALDQGFQQRACTIIQHIGNSTQFGALSRRDLAPPAVGACAIRMVRTRDLWFNPGMRPAFNTVGVVGKYDSAHLTPSLERLIAFLRARGRQVVVDNRSIDALASSRINMAALEELGAKVDLAVVLGGDGTLLSAARRLTEHDVPLVGINLGRLGFLTDIPADSMEPMLGQIYALSCGGPIVHPSLPAVILAPICPHTLSNRPIVLSERSRIEVMLVRGPSANVNFDVQNSFDLQEDDRIVIHRAAKPVRLLHPHGHSHFAMLREKLHWGAHL